MSREWDRDKERDRGRGRSRSRSRDRERDRERDRGRDAGRDDRRDRSPERRPSGDAEVTRRPRKKSNWDNAGDAAIEGVDLKQIQAAMLAMKQQQQAQTASISNPQLTRKARRSYIGNLPVGVPNLGDDIRNVVEKLMHQSGFAKAPGPCITDVWVHGDGKFGFLEFRTVEECNASMALDQFEYQGRHIKVSRPHDFEAASAIPGLGPVSVASWPQRFCGAPDINGIPVSILDSERFVELDNLLNLDVCLDSAELEDALEDVTEECGRYGKVKKTVHVVPMPGISSSYYFKVFVEFEAYEGAIRAQIALRARKFDGRQVRTQFVTEKEFLSIELELKQAKEDALLALPAPAPAPVHLPIMPAAAVAEID